MSKISVIVPVYKVKEEYLKKCIDSIINQTMRDIEIILIVDETLIQNAIICDEYAKMDNRVKTIHKKNEGVSAARNEGIKYASAEFIMFVDADDWIESDCCKIAYDNISKDEKIEVICWCYYKNYKTYEEKNIIFNKTEMIDCSDTDINYYDMKIIGNIWTKLYSKKILKNECFNEKLSNGEDVEFNFRIFKNLKHMLILNEPLYHYRIHEDSLVRKYNVAIIEEYEKTLSYMKNDLQDENNKLRIRAYYTFGAVAYLMICMNTIFTKEYDKSYWNKVEDLKILSQREPYQEILKNSNSVKLPFTRKLPLILAKYHIYSGLNFMIKIKKILMSR